MKINWKYAIGEILIVIIGISLAFSLNNWKERQVNQKLKQQYLENLESDIEEEIKQLEQNQEAISKKLAQIKIVRPYLGNKQAKRDSIAQMIFQLGNLVNFYPENSTYQTLINSGDMKLIDNFQLRRSLEAHFALQKIVLQDYGRIEKIHERYLGDFFIYKMDYRDVFMGKHDFLDDPLISNIITSIEGSYFMVMKGNQKCLKSNEALLEKIQLEQGN